MSALNGFARKLVLTEATGYSEMACSETCTRTRVCVSMTSLPESKFQGNNITLVLNVRY